MTERSGQDPVEGSYDRWSHIYDVDANATRDLNALVLREQSAEFKGRDVLELGCGTGKNTEWLALYSRQVLGMDFSAGMLEKARARLTEVRHVEFVQHDVRERWPVGDASRDRIVASLVLEHVEDLRPLFVQAARVLRPGGMFLLSELHPFRQLEGARAKFVRPEDAQLEVIRAFLHDVSDYVSAGLAAGLGLHMLDEWRDAGAGRSSVPRLLSMAWLKPA